MFRFIELTLQDWDYFQNVRVPLHGDVVLVTGPNGSGKTTFIDAIRQLVGARRLSSKRHTEHYVRDPARFPLIRAVVSNTVQNASVRPFLHERITSDEVTLACAIVTSRSGDLERRYAIRPGRATAAELQEVLLESRDFYPPERYQRALQNAGLSRSMLHVIALEQGKTNALFEVGPRDLFERVIDTRGDHEILERYRDARRRYEDTEKELNQQIAALHRNQVELDTVRRDVERLNYWIEARDRVAYLEAVLPAAQLQEKLRRKRELGSQVKTLQNKERTTENEISTLEVRLEELRGVESATKTELDSAAEQERQSQAARDDAVEARARAQAEVFQLEKKRADLDALGSSEGEIQDLERSREQADRAKFRAEEEHEQLAARVQQVEQRIERLRAGLSDYPEAVLLTLDELRKRSIPAKPVAETVEVERTGLAEATESALGMARYGIVVAEAHAATAISVARDLRFPGPVYGGPVLDERRLAGPLALEQGAPVWLASWPQAIKLFENGTWHNHQGMWATPVEDRVLGESGRKAALERAEQELVTAREGLPAANAALAAAIARQETARAALKREERRRELAEALVRLGEVHSVAQAASVKATEAEQQLMGARTRLAAARAGHESASAELKDLQLRHLNARDTLATIRTDLESKRAEVAEVDTVIANLDTIVRPDLRARAEHEELTAPETVEHDLKEAKVKFESFGAPPSETVRDSERVLRANVEEAERHVKERAREAEVARNELEECRIRYLEVVNQTLVDYRRRVREIAEIAGVASEVDIPKLINDERLLDEARIGVCFGFDNKDPVPLGHPSFSGGQQVIAGLILLMAMAEIESHGFFMLDEPFAHLSLDRIDHVGRFLRSTRSQFIITAPTTLDRAQFDPATIAIVLQKKRAEERYAPTPIVVAARV
jgi:chromosome segregation protein